MGCTGGRGHRNVRWSVCITIVPCTDESQLGTDIQMPTVWRQFQCGASHNIVNHIRRPANKKCLDMFSESGDLREMDWVRLSSQSEVAETKTNCCSCCEEELTRTSMLRHLETPDSLQYAGKSGDPKLKEILDQLTAGGLTLGGPVCRHQFPRSRFAAE